MPTKNKQIITIKQAKKQVDTFGISLIIYIVLSLLLWNGSALLRQYNPDIFMGYDPDLITLSFISITTLFVTLVPFRLSAKKLHLNIKDYLHKVEMSRFKILALCCVATGIVFIITSFTSLYGVFFDVNSSTFAFVGHFTTPLNIARNIVYFLFFVLIQPVCDEYIFRGIIQRQLGHYGRYFGVVASSVLYALAQPSFSQALIAFALGWYLSLVTLRYHSIRPAIAVHMFTAFFSWLLLVIPDQYVIIPTILIVCIYVIAGIALFTHQIDYELIRGNAFQGRLWKIVFTSPTILICVILFILNITLLMNLM